VKITLSTLREMPQREVENLRGADLVEARRLVREALDGAGERMKRILDTAAGRDLTAAQTRDFDAARSQVESLDPLREALEQAADSATLDRSRVGVGRQQAGFRAGQPLTAEQRMTDYVQARGLVRDDEQDLSFGKYVRGLLTGDWDGADAERRALVEGTATAGGHLVPTPLSARIIDRARNQTRVLQAGAQIVPMEAQTLKLARVVGDPTAAWHTELATIAASDMTFDAVTLSAKTLAARVLISRELMEDAEAVDDEVEKAFAAQFSPTVDLAALYGSGTAPEPRGVKNHPDVTKTALDANGRTPTYDDLIDSVYRVRTANHEPTAQIFAPRTGQTFAKTKDTTGQYLSPPTALEDVRRLDTVQVPTNLTVGTSTDTSDVFTADWRELLVGVRTRLEITVLRERSMDVGAYELLAWWRGDVAVARPAAFDVLTGVRA
jgi:HK97 family phage major capsid protein